MDGIVILAIVVAFAYVILYLRGRYYNREGFESCATVLDTSLEQDRPYMTNQDKYGDFEADFIYQNEGGYDPTRNAINAARRRFPFDWSQLPPSSSLFQAQQALFAKEGAATAAPFVKETFETLESRKVLPPDGTEDQKEIDALKAYQAKTAGDLKTVDQESVDKLIKDIYGEKGLVAKVARKANNVFEVYEVEEKDPKIVYEDDPSVTGNQNNALNPLVGGEGIVTPGMGTTDIDVGLAPYGRGESTTNSRRNYSDYNPNLEQIFGPKMQWQQWG